MKAWKLTGVAATLAIVLLLPLYLLRSLPGGGRGEGPPSADFVGAGKCAECHKPEYDKWKGSHHERAMDLATEASVRGDFNDATFERHGVTSRFYRRDGRFFVHTQGPGGRMGDFEITHSFGWYPLQQYLVPFPGGRLQCLPLAWDSREGRWYHLYPDEPLDPGDWLYWTNQGQNWNGMCAECHSTRLRKNYDPATDSYRTAWSEINVSCEACHGPGARHVAWAETPAMGRLAADNADLLVRTRDITSAAQMALCAPCHARRMSLGDNTHEFRDFMDYAIPQLLRPGLYFADGQILEEVYVYGSFVQSKMHAREVRCSDCHDVHSVKRLADGNALCLQCHRADLYDGKNHHFHKQQGEAGEAVRAADGRVLFEVGTGALCEQCHMPGRNYMGVDYRPDHSFRLPRPDLSLTLGVPNACNRCHHDQSDQWSADYLAKWYGTQYRPHYGTILDAGRRGLPGAAPDLIRLAGDRLYPPIVRATALFLLSSYSGPAVTEAFERSLADEESLVRHTALSHLPALEPQARRRRVAPLLYDPVKAVRIEAARDLAASGDRQLGPLEQERCEAVLREYIAAMEYTADFASSRHNLGNLYAALGEVETAAGHYAAAMRIDDQFYPAKVNLAMLYNRMGRNAEAEVLLREVVAAQPGMPEVRYSLGLLLAERENYAEAALYLAEAARGLPERSRVHYNLGMLLDFLGKDLEAERALLRARELDRENVEYQQALAQFYLKRERFGEARALAEEMARQDAAHALGRRILEFLETREAGGFEREKTGPPPAREVP